jgi:hypothetical protein
VGLLEGRQATTHWAASRALESLGATYQRKRWVEDGKFIMSAGVSAGIDMGLYLAARLTDEASARQVQLWLDYDPQPPFGRLNYDDMGFRFRLARLRGRDDGRGRAGRAEAAVEVHPDRSGGTASPRPRRRSTEATQGVMSVASTLWPSRSC